MALKLDFYKEIIEKEKMWLANLESNLLNVYYLPELRDFYIDKYQKLNDEVNLTGNALIKTILGTLRNIILKLNYFIEQYQIGNEVNLNELKNLFLLNILNNDFQEVKKDESKNNNLEKIVSHKSNLYELRQKVINEGSEDFLDDDFYYNGDKVI